MFRCLKVKYSSLFILHYSICQLAKESSNRYILIKAFPYHIDYMSILTSYELHSRQNIIYDIWSHYQIRVSFLYQLLFLPSLSLTLRYQMVKSLDDAYKICSSISDVTFLAYTVWQRCQSVHMGPPGMKNQSWAFSAKISKSILIT